MLAMSFPSMPSAFSPSHISKGMDTARQHHHSPNVVAIFLPPVHSSRSCACLSRSIRSFAVRAAVLSYSWLLKAPCVSAWLGGPSLGVAGGGVVPGRGFEAPRFCLGGLESDACRVWSCVAVRRRQRRGAGVPRCKVRRRVCEAGMAAVKRAAMRISGKEAL